MRIRMKINQKTGVTYVPKVLLEDGFKGDVNVFGYGPVLVIVRPGADIDTISESLTSINKDMKMTPNMKR